MKTHQNRHPRLLLATALAGTCLLAASAGKLSAQAAPPMDPAIHAAHVKSGAMPPDAAKGDPALAQQLAEMQAKMAQIEATLAKNSSSPMPAAPAMPAMPGMGAGAPPPPAAMPGMAAAPPAGGGMGMMGMMDKMMGMMDKMMPPGGGMGMDMMKMGAMPPMPPAPPAAMSGGGMGMMGMGMMGMDMMGMSGGSSAMPTSALPGFPGASHLYHIGATGFFLDHPQHIALTTEQQAALNKIKEQAELAKGTADRAVEQAEQELWTLTSADQPDAVKIEAKLAAIGKLTAEERLAFIRAVGDASKLLTDDQRKSLTGFAPPAPAMPAAAMPGAMPAAGMPDM